MVNRFDPIRPLMDTDAYKLGHIHQYPIGTTGVLSNFTNRGSRIPRATHVVHFGLQAFLQSWAIDAWAPFFAADEDLVAGLYEEFTTSVLGPNAIGSTHIRALHRKGHLPLEFNAVPEGTLVPLRVPSFTVENTEPQFYWLVNYIETAMSAVVWQPSTSATTAHYFRKLLDEWAAKTTGSTEGVEWQGHDFSFRGMAGIDAAAASAAGHLLSFTGSDNLNAVNFVNDFYSDNVYDQLTPAEKVAFDKNGSVPERLSALSPNGLILGSVPATEHSVMCAGGSDEGEEQATYERLIDLYPTGIVSVVSDTWDLWNVLTEILPNLKDKILARDGKLVIRPDSGDPVDIVSGTIQYLGREGSTKEERKLLKRYNEALLDNPLKSGVNAEDGSVIIPARTPAEKGVIELLWEVFGGTVNEQGYKVLDSHIGAIYGDSISYERADEISKRLAAKGFASTNIVYGLGSYTYQYVTRDTFASAIKATWVSVGTESRSIAKDPVTDNGTKKSAKGRLAVVRNTEGELVLLDEEAGATAENTPFNELKTVWRNGEFLRYQSFAEVRNVLANG